MRVRRWLGMAGLAVVLGCGGGSKGGSGKVNARVSAAAAGALTDGLSFVGGIVKAGGIPDASNDKVTLDPGSELLALVPAASTLMSLDVTNPDEASDPVTATLVQFGDSSNGHVEIPRMEAGASDAGNNGSTSANDRVHIDLQIAVGKDICKDLCNDKIQVKMLLAALLTSGGVGQHATRTVNLDCSLDGDASKCSGDSTPPPTGGVCQPAQTRCSENGVQTCSKTGQWGASSACSDQACVGGACVGVCEPGATQCSGLIPQSCDVSGKWKSGLKCKSMCSEGACQEAADAGVDAGRTVDAGMDAGVKPPAPDAGTDAGTPKVDAGPSCVGGASCTYTANACHEGIVACDASHQPVCQDNGPKTNGAGCGEDHVCFGGSCVACKIGDTCDGTNPCRIGVYDSCANGPHCALADVAPDGMACGAADLVCSSGICVSCQQDAPCTPTNQCHDGITDCANGPACTDLQTNVLDGSFCASNGGNYCQAGVCTPCHAGDACVPAGNPCRVGQIACGGLGSVCSSTGALAQDGTGCGMGKVCMTGNCVTTSWQLAVASGDNQSKRVDDVLLPVTLSVKDQNGTPVPNVVIQIGVPAGAYAPATAVTNASGIATVVARLGRATGSYVFTASSSAAPSVSFSATATAPPRGTLFNVVSQSHVSGQDGIGGPATMAHVSYAYSVLAASDGTLYFGDYCSVFAVSPAGVITRVAGTGNCGSGPDIGAATTTAMYYPVDLALDEANGLLYIADQGNNKVRQLNLATGTMQTYAGGGTTSSADYGDNQLATLGVLSSVSSLALDSSGNLYIGDAGHNRIRKVDTAQVITTWLNQATACPASSVQFYGCSSNCTVAWDKNGQAFVSGYFCGAPGSVYGIARVESDGSLTMVAGASSSSATGDGIQANATYFPSVPRLAFDAAGNLYTSSDSENRIRRIDAATGIITTVAGDKTSGYKGDYIDGLSGAQAEFYQPKDIALDAAGNLYVADFYNYTLRAIWGAGDTTANTATMAISAGNGQSAHIDALFSPALAVSLTDGASVPIAGATIAWQTSEPGAGVTAPSSQTNLSGVAAITGRAGLAVGDYHVTARYRDLHGHDAAGSPATFVVHATAPTTGDVFTIVNTDHSSGTTSQAMPGTFAHTSYAGGVAAGSDGTLYIGENCQVSTLSPQGVLTPLAGNGSCGFAGDGGRAIDARLYSVYGLLLDESNPSNRLLYINDLSNQKIRVVTLDSNPPAIDTLVGYTGPSGSAPGGPGFGVPGPGTGVALSGAFGMAVNPADHNLYLVDSGHSRILQVDAAGNVTTFFTSNSSCTGTINLYSFPSYASIAWAPGGIAYISGYICGTATSSSAVVGVVQRASNGTLTWIAGQTSTAGNSNDGTLATSTYFPSLGAILLGPGATSLYMALYQSNIVRQISALDGSGTVTTVAGNGSSGAYSGDYVPATTAQFYQPWSLAMTPTGHLVVADYYNYAFREIW